MTPTNLPVQSFTERENRNRPRDANKIKYACIERFQQKRFFKPFTSKTTIPLYCTYEKGDFRDKERKTIHEYYRISLDVSDKECDDLEGQIKDTIAF